jgi:RNA polymerase sigma-32 factor
MAHRVLLAEPPTSDTGNETAMTLRTDTHRGHTPLETYLADINRYALLSIEQEQELARRHRDQGDTRAAHLLVTSNLRFVVKVAYEYRSYGLRMPDLVQEGNIGLMRAVQKFDPDKGIRLISYAVWWIRAYIQNFILKSWSLVKLGTTQAQRKLFFSLARTQREIGRFQPAGEGAAIDPAEVARKLGVRPDEVVEMQLRMEGRDLSLDAPVGDDGAASHVDFVACDVPGQDEELSGRQEGTLLAGRVAEALARLDARERFIIEARLMSDRPRTLKDLGDHFGFSRERARQLEIRAKEKLRAELQALAAEVDWPTDGEPVEVEEQAA